MSQKKKKSKWYHYAFHLLAFVVALVFLAAGGTKFIPLPAHVENFTKWGFPLWFMYLTGGVEVAGALLFIIPMTRYYGATLLFFTMIGAIFTHIRAGEWFLLGTPVLLLILTLIIAIRQMFKTIR